MKFPTLKELANRIAEDLVWRFVGHLKTTCRFFTHKKVRIAVALCISAGFLVGISYVINRDLSVEKKQFLRRRELYGITYYITLKSFDIHNSVVRGNLQVEIKPWNFALRPGMRDERRGEPGVEPGFRYKFGPLLFFDRSSSFLFFGLSGRKATDPWLLPYAIRKQFLLLPEFCTKWRLYHHAAFFVQKIFCMVG